MIVDVESVAVPLTAPVPVRGIDCGELATESVRTRKALRGPVAPGENVREMLQLAPAASELPQVFAYMLKSAAFTPESDMPVIERVAPPVFETVTCRGAAVVPSVTVPNAADAGLTLTFGTVPLPPVPVRDRSSPDSNSEFSERISVPLAAPLFDGTNANAITHDEPGATAVDFEQSTDPDGCCTNPDGTVMLENVSGRLPISSAVRGYVALCWPTFTVPKDTG